MKKSDAALERWAEDREKLGFSPQRSKNTRIRTAFLQMLGARYGKLLVTDYAGLSIRPDGIGARPLWHCVCDCGNETTVKGELLRVKINPTRSCGSCPVEVPKWNEWTLRQLALAIEWEGAIGVYEQTGSAAKAGVSHSPKIVVSVVEEDRVLVDRLQRISLVGNVTTTRTNDVRRADGIRRMAQWQVSGPWAIGLARALEPYLITKYQQAAAVAGFPYKAEKHAPVTQEALAERKRLYALTLSLNKTGPGEQVAEAEERAAQWIHWAQTASDEQRGILLAQAIDFEGCVSVAQRRKKDCIAGVSHEPIVVIDQAQRRRALLKIAAALAGDDITKLRHTGGASDGTRDLKLAWGVSGARALEIIKMAAPYIAVKHRQAQTVLRFPVRSKGPTPISAKDISLRLRLFKKVKRLNLKGTAGRQAQLKEKAIPNEDRPRLKAV